MRQPASYLEIMQWTNEECKTFLESQRWPDGPICPKCGAEKPYTINRKSKAKNLSSFYKCRSCRKQCTATVGTIFEDSHIPLSKWFAAIYLMCSSKKGVSAHQIHRMLNVTYKRAPGSCVRAAMKEDMSPLVGIVEADETYIGGKSRRGHPVANHERRLMDAEARGASREKWTEFFKKNSGEAVVHETGVNFNDREFLVIKVQHVLDLGDLTVGAGTRKGRRKLNFKRTDQMRQQQHGTRRITNLPSLLYSPSRGD